ncbi:S26 family signal peptidase [Halospeciosus flavus]|uniref:S26 family signal peptidase n=1 Tax=Halospeciosus flavus TaxID=3032283 RepID=UPI00361FF990
MTSSDDVPDPRQGPLAALRWLYRTDHGLVAFCREAASGVLAVALVALLLFGVTGVWPPVAAIESGSMEPHLHPGDAVIVAEPDRFGPAGVHDTGVVTYQRGQETGYTSVGAPGDVIVYYPNGEWKTPVIHRARFWVEEGRTGTTRRTNGSSGPTVVPNSRTVRPRTAGSSRRATRTRGTTRPPDSRGRSSQRGFREPSRRRSRSSGRSGRR